jgi:phasin protein
MTIENTNPHATYRSSATGRMRMAQDFNANTERTLQEARAFAEESFNQGKRTFDGLMRVTRKMAEDWESQAHTIRDQATSLTEKSISNALEFGQKLAKAKEPQEFAQCQSEYWARQAQTIVDGTKEFTERMREVSQKFAQNTSSAMAETSRHAQQAVSNIGSRTEQASRRQQRAEA